MWLAVAGVYVHLWEPLPQDLLSKPVSRAVVEPCISPTDGFSVTEHGDERSLRLWFTPAMAGVAHLCGRSPR